MLEHGAACEKCSNTWWIRDVLEYGELRCTTCGGVRYFEPKKKSIPQARRGRPSPRPYVKKQMCSITKQCSWCTKDFEVHDPAAVKTKRYCTSMCSTEAWEAKQRAIVVGGGGGGGGEALRGDAVRFGGPQGNRIERACIGCARTMILKTGSSQKYCNRKCYWTNGMRKEV